MQVLPIALLLFKMPQGIDHTSRSAPFMLFERHSEILGLNVANSSIAIEVPWGFGFRSAPFRCFRAAPLLFDIPY